MLHTHFASRMFFYIGTIMAASIATAMATSPVHAEAVQSTLNLSIESGGLNLLISSEEGGSFAESSDYNVSISTNNFSGYALYVSSVDSTSLSDGKGNEIQSIETPISYQEFSTNASYNNKWGFKPSKSNSQINSSFLPAPSTNGLLIDRTDSANLTANDYIFNIGTRADYSLPAGTYSRTIVFSAVSNDITYNITYEKNTTDTVTNMPNPNPQGSTIDGGTAAEDSHMVLSSSEPMRDRFSFIGWCDEATTADAFGSQSCNGNTYEAGDNYDIDQTADGSNIVLYAIWQLTEPPVFLQDVNSARLNELLPNEGDSIVIYDKRDNTPYHVGKLADGNFWMLDNLAIDLVNTPTATLKGNTNASDAAIDYLKNGGGTASDPYAKDGVVAWTEGIENTATSPLADVSHKDVVENAGNYNGAGSFKTGGYYNVCAASAGTICTDERIGTDYENGNMVEDICPAGWHTPSTGFYMYTGYLEYRSILQLYSNDFDAIRTALSIPFVGVMDNGVAGIDFGLTTSYLSSIWEYNFEGMDKDMPIVDGNGTLIETQHIRAFSESQQYNNYKLGYSMRCIKHSDVTTVTLDQNGATTDGSTSVEINYKGGIVSESIENPVREHTITGFTAPSGNNASGATVSSTDTITISYPFEGWYTGSYNGYSNKVIDENGSLVASAWNHTDSNGNWKWGVASGTGLLAHWTITPVTLPTITKANYTCGWTTESSNATGFMYASGASIVPDERNTTLYGVCIEKTYMQNWTGCQALGVGKSVVLHDSRDETPYMVGKLADGNCWMQDNLAIDLVNTPLETLKGNTNATDLSLEYLKNGGGTATDKYASSAIGSSTWGDGTRKNKIPGADMANKDTVSTATYTNSTGNGNGSRKIGGKYNYCAASAGSFCIDSENYIYEESEYIEEISEDICPAGWQLPKGWDSASDNYSSDLLDLAQLYPPINYLNTTFANYESFYTAFSPALESFGTEYWTTTTQMRENGNGVYNNTSEFYYRNDINYFSFTRNGSEEAYKKVTVRCVKK